MPKCWSLARKCAFAGVLVVTTCIAAVPAASAQPVTVTWDPSSGTTIAGYIVHTGTQPGVYTSHIDAGAVTTLTVDGLDWSRNNYFSVQAYSTDGLLSSLSPEVLLPAIVPPTISAFTVSTNPPFLTGTPVTFGTAATSTRGAVEYKYMLYRERAGWTVAQDYGPSPTFTWTPAWGDVGKAAVQVWVRTVGSKSVYEAWRGTVLFDVTATPVALTADTAFPSPAGQPIVWTAGVTGTTGTIEYRYVALDVSTGQWSVVREYGVSNQASWTPPHNGKYYVQVWVRHVGSTASYETWTSSGELTIGPSPLRVLSLEADRALPVASGTPVTWTAKTVGGTAGPLLFRFVKYSVATGTWTQMQDYSTSRTFTWTPSWADAGTHVIQVWVKSTGSTASYDAYNTTGYFDVQSAPMQLSADALFPLPPTQTVTWTASVPDTSAPVEYAFFLYDQSKGTWSVARAYSTSSTYAWTPGAAGVYVVQAWARRVGSTAQYEAYRSSDYLTVASGPAHIKTFTANKSLPARVGTPITWTATANGGSSTGLLYRFLLYSQATGWSQLRDYGTGNSVTWTPTVAGNYSLQVWVKSVGSAAAYEDWISSPAFVIQP